MLAIYKKLESGTVSVNVTDDGVDAGGKAQGVGFLIVWGPFRDESSEVPGAGLNRVLDAVKHRILHLEDMEPGVLAKSKLTEAETMIDCAINAIKAAERMDPEEA